MMMKMTVLSFLFPLQSYRKSLSQVLQKLSLKLATLSQCEETVVKGNASSISDKLLAFKSKPPGHPRDMLSICSDPFTLAQQLTHIELVRGVMEGRWSSGSRRSEVRWEGDRKSTRLNSSH